VAFELAFHLFCVPLTLLATDVDDDEVPAAVSVVVGSSFHWMF
jgi:hypothetical protein